MKLTTQIVLLGAISASLLFATMAMLIFLEFPAQQDKLLKQGAWALAENLRQQVEPMVLTGERLRLDEAITITKLSDQNIDYIFILDCDRNPLASTFSRGVPKDLIDLVSEKVREKVVKTFSEGGKSRLDMSIPLMDGDLGNLHIGINREPVLAFAKVSILKLSVVFLVMTVAALITAILVGRGVGKPLGQIANALKKTSGEWPQLDDINTGPTLEVQEFIVILKQMISELKQAEQNRQDYERKLLVTERLASIGELASEVAHEINNPLDGLIEIVRYLEQNANDTQKVCKYIPFLKQGLERIGKTGRQLLRFSRSDGVNYKEMFDIYDIINNTVALLDSSMKKRGIAVHINCKKGQFGNGNAVAVGQALINLLLNASDAMANKSGRVNIDVSSGNGNVIIAVEDNGPGIGEKISERIFEPFFSTKRPDVGTGLGLAVSRNLIRKCGGELFLAERKVHGGGAKFVIELIGSGKKVRCDVT